MSFEGLDNDHGRTAGGAGVGAGGWLIVSSLCRRRIAIDGVIGQQLTQSLHLFDPGVVGEQPVVADAVEACRQHVDEEAPDELGRGQGHGPVAITPHGAIVFPLEGDATLITGNQTAVGDRHSMGVARQIGEHGFGSGEGAFGIDHPVDVAQWRQIVGEGGGIGERLMLAEELQTIGVVSGAELVKEQTSKQPREHPHR